MKKDKKDLTVTIVFSVLLCLVAVSVVMGLIAVSAESLKSKNDVEDFETYEDEVYDDIYDADDTILSTSLDELGFYNFDNMELIEIWGYKDEYVFGSLSNTQYGTTNGLKFSNGQIKKVKFKSKEDIIYNSGELSYIRPYSIFDNDSISYGSDYTLTIIERKVIDKNRVVLVMSRIGSEEWYVPRDLLDFSETENYSYTCDNYYEVKEEGGFKIPWKD